MEKCRHLLGYADEYEALAVRPMDRATGAVADARGPSSVHSPGLILNDGFWITFT